MIEIEEHSFSGYVDFNDPTLKKGEFGLILCNGDVKGCNVCQDKGYVTLVNVNLVEQLKAQVEQLRKELAASESDFKEMAKNFGSSELRTRSENERLRKALQKVRDCPHSCGACSQCDTGVIPTGYVSEEESDRRCKEVAEQYLIETAKADRKGLKYPDLDVIIKRVQAKVPPQKG